MDEADLENVINSIRKSLVAVNLEREKDADPRMFLATEAEIELKFTAQKSTAATGGLKLVVIPGLTAGGSAKRKVSEERVHTLRLKFAPIIGTRVENGKTTFTTLQDGRTVDVQPDPNAVTIHADPEQWGATGIANDGSTNIGGSSLDSGGAGGMASDTGPE
ncbi:trypco2 family protein [Sphingosinithalassobacter sp. CS137]|uniref:trypco2 family protein n=1 Tax=Sphingosinithalassobacter sp. CS137 TaxID=2762748 RepID=UPI00165E882F|nr:trypco2 family protein [Sphingosinithalassobacter sp. CS137]